MKKYRKIKQTKEHCNFVHNFIISRYNLHGIYGKVHFCKDKNIAFVIQVEDWDDYSGKWGAVNMGNQLLVPFKYERIYNYGRFLVGVNLNERDLYNKRGQMLCKIGRILKTSNKVYNLIFDSDDEFFKISIRKMAISHNYYEKFYVNKNGLAFLKKKNGKVGAILYSKLKLNFEYNAIAIPQNGYTLGIIETKPSKSMSCLYDCLLIKIKSQIKKNYSVHPTGITLFKDKTWNEVKNYFANIKQFEKECNAIVCYNERVHFCGEELKFFPFDTENLPKEYEYDEDVNKEDEYDNYKEEEPWTTQELRDSANIAYEGYSRLYLGLDD